MFVWEAVGHVGSPSVYFVFSPFPSPFLQKLMLLKIIGNFGKSSLSYSWQTVTVDAKVEVRYFFASCSLPVLLESI